MPHLIDAQPVREASAKIAALIPDPAARRRFQSLLIGRLFEDEECARPLLLEELALCADRVIAHASEAPLMAFDPPRAKILQARRHARILRDALLERDDLRALKPPLQPRIDMTLRIAEEWTLKMQRMSYDALLEKARYLLSERRVRLRAERDEQPLFPPQEIAASPGRTWQRIVSVADLRRVGRDLRNCLAGPSGQRHGYVQRLREDITRFWALHDGTRIARAVLAVDTKSGAVKEARSFRNAPFVLDGADFSALVVAGLCMAPPSIDRLSPRSRIELTNEDREFFRCHVRTEREDDEFSRRARELLGQLALISRRL